jgi:hypothetical protein
MGGRGCDYFSTWPITNFSHANLRTPELADAGTRLRFFSFFNDSSRSKKNPFSATGIHNQFFLVFPFYSDPDPRAQAHTAEEPSATALLKAIVSLLFFSHIAQYEVVGTNGE